MNATKKYGNTQERELVNINQNLNVERMKTGVHTKQKTRID